MAAKAPIALKDGSNMRDIFDVCQAHGLPSLAQGMIEFPPPEPLRQEAAKAVMKPDVHTYRTRMGEQSYREAIAGMVHQVYGEKNVGPDNVLAVAGVAGGVTAALLHLRRSKEDAAAKQRAAAAEKGEKFEETEVTMAIMEPFYTYHFHECERAFCRPPLVIPATGEHKVEGEGTAGRMGAAPNWDELNRLVDANKVHGVIITNPMNPSGHVLTEEEVNMLLDLADTKDLFVIFDECYLDMIFNDKTYISSIASKLDKIEGGEEPPAKKGRQEAKLRKNVVACRGFSKCMGCQSWRCGYAISHQDTLVGMMTMADPLYICTNWTQHAMAEYFKNNLGHFREHCTTLNALLKGNWELLREAFKAKFGWESIEPDGTMYAMFKHSDETDIKACERALRAGVGICPGNVFYGNAMKPPARSGWVRIHCGVSREKAQAIAKTLMDDK